MAIEESITGFRFGPPGINCVTVCHNVVIQPETLGRESFMSETNDFSDEGLFYWMADKRNHAVAHTSS